MICVGQGAMAVLGGGQELAVPVQDSGQHGQRVAGRGGPGGGGGGACSFGMGVVVAVQFGCGPGAGDGVGALEGHREYVREVDAGSAGQGDVGVLAVLGAVERRQADPDGAALGDVGGDRIAELGF